MELDDSIQGKLKKDITHWICEYYVGMISQSMKDNEEFQHIGKTSSSPSRELTEG